MRSVTCWTLRPAACLLTVCTTALERSNSCTKLLLLVERGVGLVGQKLRRLLEHKLDRAVDGLLDAGAQADAHLLDRQRLAGDDDDLAGPSAGELDEAQDGLGVHAVRVERVAVLDARRDLVLVDLHDVERAGRPALAAD